MADTEPQTSSYIGPYRLEERLGRGGMGEVFRAWDERLERQVALKQIRPTTATPNARERFRREARATARLNHPAIVQIHDILETSNCDWIVMELVEGKTVALLLKGGPFEVGQACHLGLQVTAGLVAAHNAGVLHRDLKAENVIVTRDGNAKILDFGLAKSLWSGSWDRSISNEGQVVGTPRAMSPEQAMGHPIDHRSDLFSLGVLLYEMVTGLSPFEGPGPFETVSRVCSHRQTPAHEHNHDVPLELSRLINRLLQKQPDNRPEDSEEVLGALHSLVGSLQGSSGVFSASGVSSGIRPGPAVRTSAVTPPTSPMQVVTESQVTQQWTGTLGTMGSTMAMGAAAQTIQTLMLTDLVDSTSLVERLGDQRSLEIFARHDRLARSLLEKWGGREIDKSDGFLLLFKRPADAVRYALEYHAALQELSEVEQVRLRSRVGIHLGEIFLRENPHEEVARGAKPLEVEGFAKSTAARVMGLAGGRQTLMSRGAYELAQRALAHATDLPNIKWMSHGLYRMKGVAEPMEICEVGVEGLAPLKRPADASKAVRFVPEEEKRPRPDESSGRATSERRQITLMCCELVGSDGSSSTSLDPEVLFEVMPEFQGVVAKAAEHYDGHVGIKQGHRSIVYFGYPIAREDAARRAVLAGLEVARSSAERAEEDPSNRLAVRVAVHTGPAVLMATPAVEEQLVLGVTQELATGTLTLSKAHEVVVSAATRQLVEKHFHFENLVPTVVPGLDLPIEGFRVVETSDSSTGEAGPLSQLVARERELDTLLNLWRISQEGTGQLVLLSGEAGIGKTRMIQELRERLNAERPTWLSAYGSPYNRNSPLAPIVEMLLHNLGIDREEPPRFQLKALSDGLKRFGLMEADFLPYLAPLLSLPLDAQQSTSAAPSPELLRQRTLEALVSLIQEIADQQPTMVLIEDLQWVDPSTLEMIGLLAEHCEAVPMLLILTFRHEFKAPWGQLGHATQVNLRRLTNEQTSQLTDRLTEGRSLPDEAHELIANQTDGVPLFVEEMVKSLLESGQLVETPERYLLAEPLRPLKVPATLRDLLLSRLDALGDAKEVAQIAAAVGREFSFELLDSLEDMPERLEDELDELVAAEIVRRKGFKSRARYVFKHAMIQEAAYESLLKPRRREIHRQIANVLKGRFPEIRERQPEILGHHFEQAGLVAEAMDFLLLAGQTSTARSAYVEAGRHLDRGLELLETQSLTNDRQVRELDFLHALSIVQTALKGYAADDLRKTFTRARGIIEQLGDTPQLLNILHGLFQYHLSRGDREIASGLSQRILDITKLHADMDQKVVAHANAGFFAFWSGELEAASDYFARALEIRDRQLDETVTIAPSTNDIVVLISLYLAWTYWFLGRLEEARDYLDFDHDVLSPFDRANALTVSAIFAYEDRDVDEARRLGGQVHEVAVEFGLPFWKIWGDINVGWARAVSGEANGGIGMIHESLATCNAIGQRMPFGYLHGYLARASLGAGRIDEGLNAIEEAISSTQDGLERFYLGGLLSIKGDLLQAQGDADAATGCYEEAIGIAQKQGSRMLELRALTSLVRLQKGGTYQERLAELRRSLPQTSVGHDLEEADRLLAELPQGS